MLLLLAPPHTKFDGKSDGPGRRPRTWTVKLGALRGNEKLSASPKLVKLSWSLFMSATSKVQ